VLGSDNGFARVNFSGAASNDLYFDLASAKLHRLFVGGNVDIDSPAFYSAARVQHCVDSSVVTGSKMNHRANRQYSGVSRYDSWTNVNAGSRPTFKAIGCSVEVN
jgi:hypothetical protein